MGRTCFVCASAMEGHAPCAVCHADSNSVRLCSFCRAQNKVYGIDWNESDMGAGVDEDIGSDERRELVTTISDVVGRRRARPTPKRDRAVRLLANRRDRELVHYVDRRGHWRGYYERARFLSRREIARMAGCSHTYVNRIFRESIAIRSSRG